MKNPAANDNEADSFQGKSYVFSDKMLDDEEVNDDAEFDS